MKTLSISVAAYNMEKLIRQNLDSFVNSKCIDDIEVLVINDGSKDSTADIVLEYQSKYPDSVKLINQDNAGPGSTVNRGIEHATGKYFRMVDADDWVDKNGFERLVETLKYTDADMAVCDYTMVDDKTNDTLPCKITGITPNTVVDFEEVCESVDFVMHNTAFKTSILKDNNIKVFNGFYTDIQYLLFPVPFVKTLLYVDCNVYMYRVSLTGQSMAPESLQRNLHMHDAMVFSITKLYNKTKPERPAVARYILNKLVSVLGCQLSTLLSFAPTTESKTKLFGFLSKLKAECPDAYKAFSRKKTVIALNIGNGVMYKKISELHRKKLGL